MQIDAVAPATKSGERRDREQKGSQMILVTGAAGLSGSAIIREFASHGEPVRALVRNRAKAGAFDLFPTAEVVEGDMHRPETLGPALKGVNRTLMISTTNPHMVETQCTFIDACRKAGVRHVVKFSGAESGIGFDPSKFRFTQMHEDVEDYLEQSGLAWTQLRPSQFMQVYLREAPTIAANGELRLPYENINLSPIDIADIAKIAFLLLRDAPRHEGKSYDMTGPEALTMTEIADRISRAIGKPVRYVGITREDRRRALLATGMAPENADALDEQTAERVRRPQSRVDLSTHERFGVRPTTFADFANRHSAEFRAKSPAA